MRHYPAGYNRYDARTSVGLTKSGVVPPSGIARPAIYRSGCPSERRRRLTSGTQLRGCRRPDTAAHRPTRYTTAGSGQHPSAAPRSRPVTWQLLSMSAGVTRGTARESHVRRGEARSTPGNVLSISCPPPRSKQHGAKDYRGHGFPMSRAAHAPPGPVRPCALAVETAQRAGRAQWRAN